MSHRATPAPCPALTVLPAVTIAAHPEPAPLTKAAWRALADACLRNRTPQQRRAHALSLAQAVTALAVQLGARRVGLYSPVGAEVETRDLAYALQAAGMELAYPRMRPSGDAMDFAASTGPDALAARPRTRILEPTGPIVPASSLDVLVVPGLAFGPDLRRLGRGGGHFDRYLPTLRADCVTIGCATSSTILAWSPVEAHDIALDYVCTEAGLFGPAVPA